jgi:hypothetical protein
MKIIINESQLRLIVEGEGKLLPINEYVMEELGVIGIVEILKTSGKYGGIKFIGDLSLSISYYLVTSSLGKEEGIEILEYFCDNLVIINGNLDITSTPIRSFEKLRSAYGIDGSHTNGVIYLPSLVELKDYGLFNNTDGVHLPELVEVGGDLFFVGSYLTSLPKLRKVGTLNLLRCKAITSLPELVEVGKKGDEEDSNLTIAESNISELPKLKSVTGDLIMRNNIKIKSLDDMPNLKYIGHNFDLERSLLSDYVSQKDIKNRMYVGLDIWL